MRAARAIQIDSSTIGVLAARAHAARSIEDSARAPVPSPARALHARLEQAARNGFIQPATPQQWTLGRAGTAMVIAAALSTGLATLALGLHLLG